ncbi:MAG: ROK family protein [Planctomycetales bacterium]|nr:ROK family protein [Planctomycetales bacterium]
MNPLNSSTIAAGVDIGGTKIAVGLVDAHGEILAQRSFPTEASLGFERGVERIVRAIDECLAEVGSSCEFLEGVGVGCAGPVHPKHGTIDNPYTLPTWDGVDIVSPLRATFDRPAVLENDADAAAVGEAYFGAGRGARSVVMLTFGTGVGSGVLIDGRIYRGATDTHPELGHLPFDPAGPECYCGVRGCLESLASGTAISAAGKTAGFGDARGVFAALKAGDKQARAIVDRAISAVNTAAWTIQHSLLPERIILGGGIIDEHYNLFADAVRKAVENATLNPRGCTDVQQARLGNLAGIVGAAQCLRIAQ